MITHKVWELVKKLYTDLDELVNLVGLEYDYENDEYICHNTNEVDEEWCDSDMLRSIEKAHADIGFFLRDRV